VETESGSSAPLAPGRGRPATTKRPARKHASITEQIKVLDLAGQQVTQTEIARITGISQQTVSAIIARHAPTTLHALDVLKANSYKAAVDWVRSFNVAVKRGEHRPMRDALIATGVVAPDPQAQGVTVIVGSGDVALMTNTHSKASMEAPSLDTTHHNSTSDILIPHEPI